MNKKFLSAILFGALMVTSTGTFVSCKDYDDDIEQLSNEKDKLSQQIAELEKQVNDAATKAELEALKNQLSQQGADLDAIQKALDELKKSLTSLVFVPQAYFGGIEAMNINTINYTSWALDEVDANKDYSEDAPEAGSPVQMTDMFMAEYHVNPSSVTKDDVVNVSFLAADKESRAYADVIKTNVFDWDVQNGKLQVFGQIYDGSIKTEEEQGKITVLAAQAEIKKDDKTVTVTSDYAVAVNKKADGFHLAFVAEDAKEGEEAAQCTPLYQDAATALDNESQLTVAWNAEMDLAEVISAHYTNEELFNVAATAGAFEYHYELVGWLSGENETSESAHAAINGSVLRPQMTDGGMQQAYGADQSKATIGRQPLVRVSLYDNVSKKVAAVGYVKITIVAEPETEKEWTADVYAPKAFVDEFTVNCANGEYEFSLTWAQVEEQIIAKLGISKDEFEETYKLESSDEDADQFTATTVDAKIVTAKSGIVSKTTTDTESNMTEVLKWTITENEAYQIFKAGKTSITVNVRFANAEERKYMYVTFTWTPDPLNITPNGEIEDASKIKEYWYAKNGAVAGEGYSDIHANVQQVISDNAADCTFNSDILNTLVNNKITVKSDETYPAFADDKLNKSIVFAPVQDHLAACEVAGHEGCYVVTGASGKVYEITVSVDGKTLNANVLGETTVEPVVVLADAVMQYQENETAKDILNYADHAELGDGETFTAKLMFDAYLCEAIDYTLNNKVFYAKYLRPVSADPADVEELVDAANGASEAALNLQLVDWRDKHFDNDAETDGYNFYGFYDISAIEEDIEAATTDLNGGTLGETLLSSITNNVKLEFVKPEGSIAKGNHGKFTYLNNGTTLGKFTVRVPLTITYKWGKIYTSVDLIINKTINN